MKNLDTESKYFRARERVEAIKKFYLTLIFYVVVNAFLAGVNYYADEWRYPWFLWVVFGWGLGLAFQAAKAFGFNPFFGKDWEARKIRQFMDQERNRDQWK